MCKEMPVIPVDRAADKNRIIGQKWRDEEEDRHKGSLTKEKHSLIGGRPNFHICRQ
jgi:hypothetical protein